MLLNKKQGFTLLEILVVIIIVGVLASVALPSLYQNVERSRGAEAYHAIGIIKRALDACATQFNGDYNSCAAFSSIGMADPSGAADSHFIYSFEPIIGRITALRNNLDNGDGNSYISMRIDLVTKQVGFCTFGVFTTPHPNNPPGMCTPPET
jgi:prepilin-type N-terminal cleavage/methylation domain-containing protein